MYPVNDLIEHNSGIVDGDYVCMCGPEFRYDWNEGVCIVVHAAMDRRECFE